MAETMKDWHDREIQVARSRGGKVSVCDYEDNLIIPGRDVWPHPDIVKKLHKSEHAKDFNEAERPRLEDKLGFYCDLQSLRSEDAITWSVFGTLCYFPKSSQVRFVNSLLERIGKKPTVSNCTVQLWTRIAHPDTQGPGGPELDFLIAGDNVVIFGESKWTSKVATGQGKKGNKDQLQLRQEFLDKYGNRIFPGTVERVVLATGVDPVQGSDPYSHLSWEEICEDKHHPLGEEVNKYYKWKEKVGK